MKHDYLLSWLVRNKESLGGLKGTFSSGNYKSDRLPVKQLPLHCQISGSWKADLTSKVNSIQSVQYERFMVLCPTCKLGFVCKMVAQASC